jgi:rubrerythrin
MMGYTLPEFLAHAIALETEAAERYLELADMMEAHNNLETSAVFRDMARFSTLHGEEIKTRSRALELPKLMSWQYRWKTPPEVGDENDLHYLMTPYHALRYARDNEIRGMEYYKEAAASSTDPEVRRLGTDFAAEEAEHVLALDKWIEKTPRPSVTWSEDMDPAQEGE